MNIYNIIQIVLTASLQAGARRRCSRVRPPIARAGAAAPDPAAAAQAHVLRPAPLLAALMLGPPAPLNADALSSPPPHDAHELMPVPEADLGGAEPAMREQITEARQAVAEALADGAQDNGATRLALARAYGRLGALLMLEEAEAPADACLRNAMTLDPGALRWPYYAGYMALRAGNLDAALEHLQQAQRIDPDYPPLALRLGKARLDRGELAAARAAFERAARTPALAPTAHYYLGQVALLERRHQDAVALLEEALSANPDATEVHYPLARAYRALGNEARARSHLERFELRSPEVPDPLLDELESTARRALPAFKRALHAVRNGDYALAAERFAQGLAVEPDNADARVSLARTLYLSGRAAEAEQALEQALAAEPDPILAPFLRGILTQAAGDTAAARAAYERTLEREPSHAGARFHLANLDFAAGRDAAAARHYRTALEADRKIAPARLLALAAELHAGAAERQIAERLTALRNDYPEDPQLRYAEARLLAAARDTELRDPERAAAMAAELMAQQPIPPHQRLLALAQASSGRFARAAETQQQLLAQFAWAMPAEERALAEAELSAYRSDELPAPAWPRDDPLLSPPPFDAERIIRDYPAITPY